MSENPYYFLVKRYEDTVEVRRYPATKWATTNVKANVQLLNNYGYFMYQKLVAYMQGNNNRNQKIMRTVPARYDYKNLVDTDSVCQISMKFYIPKELESNPPKPNDNIYIQTEPETTYAVIRFRGYPSINDYIYYRDKLIQKLGTDAYEYDCINMTIACYDPMFRSNIHNGHAVNVSMPRPHEIWLRKIV